MSQGASMRIRDTFQPMHPGERGHLWIVIASAADGAVLTVNFSTLAHNDDHSCVINEGEHPFVHHPTVIPFVKMKEVSPEMQRHMLANPTIAVPNARVSKSLLARIQNAALASKMVSARFKQVIRDSMNAG